MIKPSDTELPRYEMSIYEFLKLCGVDLAQRLDVCPGAQQHRRDC